MYLDDDYDYHRYQARLYTRRALVARNLGKVAEADTLQAQADHHNREAEEVGTSPPTKEDDRGRPD